LDEGREHTEHIATASQCGMEFPDLAFPGKFLVDSLPFRESLAHTHTVSLSWILIFIPTHSEISPFLYSSKPSTAGTSMA